MRYTWFIKLYSAIATIFGDKAAAKAVQGLRKMEDRQNMLASSFYHFTMNEWFFDIANLESAFDRLPSEEKDIFSLDFSLINWSTYFQYFCYGLHKYVLKENPSPPTTTDLIKSGEYKFNLYNDIEIAFSASGQFTEGFTREQIKRMVFNSKNVQIALKREAELQKVMPSKLLVGC